MKAAKRSIITAERMSVDNHRWGDSSNRMFSKWWCATI